METFNIGELLTKKFASIETLPKVEHEFQEICLELEEYFGKKKIIWSLPYRKGYTNHLMRYALKETRIRGIKNLGYFIKIINNKINETKRGMETV